MIARYVLRHVSDGWSWQAEQLRRCIRKHEGVKLVKHSYGAHDAWQWH
jgi:hypothetical protein